MMDHLVARVRQIGKLGALSDALLLSLLANSDCVPERVGNGVVLFSRGDQSTFWYLLLSGRVELYLPSTKHSSGRVIETLSAGSLFGELSVLRHTCSGRVVRTSEFVTINQNHFLALYNKHADHLQPFLTIMQDLLSDEIVPSRPPSVPPHRRDRHPFYHSSSTKYRDDAGIDYGVSGCQPRRGYSEYRSGSKQLRDMGESTSIDYDMNPPSNLFELSKSEALESRIREAGLILKKTMQTRAPSLLQDRSGYVQTYTSCMIGCEIVDWLMNLVSSSTLGTSTAPITRFHVAGMWQALLENGIISHVNSEMQFEDKHILYRWTIDETCDTQINSLGSSSAVCQSGVDAVPAMSDVSSAVFFLSTVGPDALFRMILSKPSSDRSTEELELVYDELLHVKALAHLSTMVKRELASVVFFEQHQHAGTVLFHQGDQGNSWYIILRGSVHVSIHGKGIVCTLQEGDDFGKLALVNDAPRAATITLREDNSQFLRVDKTDFNRILRDVEANTVRLKEHGHDVLVLEKMNTAYPSTSRTDILDPSSDTSRLQCCYSVMAGLPEKMVEYVLETRVDAQLDDGVLDTFLEDFILTHTIYMPTNVLCNYLKNYYTRGSTVRYDGVMLPDEGEHQILAKRRVVTFLWLWIHILGVHFFLDPVANSFVEELYCCVLEDSRQLPGMFTVLERMSTIRRLRENAMLALNRRPSVVLDCGVYCAGAPAPNPVLPFDTCNQVICLSDTSPFTMNIRLDKPASEICEMARVRVHYGGQSDHCCLVEVKSNGERVVFAPNDVSIPTMLSLNSRLYLAYDDEVQSLAPVPQQDGPVESVHSSLMELLGSVEIAHQLSVFHMQLFEATNEIELVSQVVGRDHFPGRISSNLDLLMRRFNEVQFWTTTEVLLAHGTSKRLAMLKKFIKIATHSKENRDLMSLFAITLGLSNVAVSRLTRLWEKLPSKMRRQYAEFEALLDPSRNHRAYRMLVSKMGAPTVPFVPLLLKDLTFTHEGNKTYFAGLVNFEKMHMIANVLRSFRRCKPKYSDSMFERKKIFETKNLIRNFKIIDNQRRLMELSYAIEPSRRKPYQ